MSGNSISLLTSKRFLPLFITQFLGAFNDNVFRTALVTFVTYQAVSIPETVKPIMVTLAIGLFMLPFFLFSGLAGQLADKFNKSRLIRIVKLAEIIIMALAAVGFFLENAYFLIGVLFLMGTQSTFFGPVKYSILPDHLHKDELIIGNGLIEAGTFLSILLGTIIGGLLISSASFSLLMAAVLTISIALLGYGISWFIPYTNPASPDLKVNLHFIKETWNIIATARKNESVFLSILGISWFWLVGAMFLSQLPHFSKDVLGVEQSVFILLLTIFSIGIGGGSILCNKLLHSEITSKFVPVAALLMTVFMLDVAYVSHNIIPASGEELRNISTFLTQFSSWRIMVDLLLIAGFGGIYIVPLYAIMQSHSESSHRSRIIAANNILNALFMVISSVVAMVLLTFHISIPGLFFIVALANSVVALYICKLLPETVVKSSLRWILRTLYRVKIRGLQHFKSLDKNAIIVANHVSFLDAVIIAAFLPEPVTFAVNTNIARKPFMRFALSFVHAFPLDPTNPMATKTLIDLVKQGKKVMIFPEGRLTMTGSLMKIYEGPGMIALKTQAKILPIHLEGVQYTPFSRLKGKLRTRWFPKITMTMLPPEVLSIPEGISGRKQRRAAANALYDIMTALQFRSMPSDKTLFSSLLDAREIHSSDHIIMEDVNRMPVTYREFILRSFLLGAQMAKHTSTGEYVGVLLPNTISTAVTFFGLQAFGRVPAMLNFSTGERNILSACNTAQIHRIYTSRRFVEEADLQPVIDAIQKTGAAVVFLEDIAKNITPKDKLVGWLGTRFSSYYYRFTHRRANADNPAVILFTSGSEGTPKGVVLSHKNIQANRAQLSARIDFSSQDIVFNALPLFHSFGLTAGTLLPLLSGIRIFFYPSPLHYRIVPELIYDTNATIMFGTDTFLSGYARFAHAYDFYSMRYVFAGAEKLKEETKRLWAENFGVRIFEGYGATETSPVLSTNAPMQHKAGSVGRLLPGIEHRLAPVPGIDEGGRLMVKGPNVMIGYLLSEKPDVIVPPKDGWYDTGDIVEIDQDGYITIKGRAKRFAKIAGEMVSLTAVESYISQLWPEHQHAVASIPDAKKGEQLVLITNHLDAAKDVIIAHIRKQGVSELHIPKVITTIDNLPLLGTGKTDYVAIQQLAEEQLA